MQSISISVHQKKKLFRRAKQEQKSGYEDTKKMFIFNLY